MASTIRRRSTTRKVVKYKVEMEGKLVNMTRTLTKLILNMLFRERTVIILSKAMQTENRRGTVASAQKASRKRKADTLFDNDGTNGNVDSANIVQGKR